MTKVPFLQKLNNKHKLQEYIKGQKTITTIMKSTKVHNPRAILSLLKLILFLVHEFTQIICNIHDIVTKL